MDMKLFKQHLAQKQNLQESAASQKTAKAYDDFVKAAKVLLNAWQDAIDDDESLADVDGWPLGKSFDETVEDLEKFAPKFKNLLRNVK